MIKRSTWILLAIFVLLLAGAIFLPGVLEKGQRQPATPTVVATNNLFDFQEQAVSALKIQDAKAKEMSLSRGDAGWSLVEPKAEQTDNAAAESGMTQLMAVRVLSTLEATTDLGQFGLAAPAYTMTLALQDGKQHTVLVGNVTPTGRGYYVQLDGGNPLIVDKYGLDSVLGMVDKPPIATPTVTPGVTETITPTLSTTVTPLPATAIPETVTPTP
jgi:hypothetical protein